MQEDDAVEATYQLIARLFMSMLAQLERKNLLANRSEIENLGLIMALFMVIAADSREEYGVFEDSTEEPLGPVNDKRTWKPHAFDNHILAYACKYDIDLVGDTDLDELIGEANAYVKLPVPESNNTAQADPFGFRIALEKYKADHGGITASMALNFPSNATHVPPPIGGDSLDMTTWSTTRRRAGTQRHCSDPLSKEQMDAVKKGMVLSFVEDVPERGWYCKIRVLIMWEGRVVSNRLQELQI
jgi:hypothetical protein